MKNKMQKNKNLNNNKSRIIISNFFKNYEY